MTEIKMYQCDSSTPTDAEIRKAIRIASLEKCIVQLNWFFPYSGHYSMSITENMSFDECKRQLPEAYPI